MHRRTLYGLWVRTRILIRRSVIINACQRAGFDEVYLFGSMARGQGTPDSDIDLAVSPGGPLQFAMVPNVQKELTLIFRRPVSVTAIDAMTSFVRVDVQQDGIRLL